MHSLRYVILAGGLVFCSALHAQTPDGTRYHVGAVSNYIFRGITQSDDHPALQGGVDYKHPGGLYAGAWGTTQDIPNTQSPFRMDGYAGFAYQAAQGPGFDIGGRAYSNAFVFPGQARDFFWELYGSLNFGPAMVKLSHDFDGQDTYAEGEVDYDLGSGVLLGLHAGHYFLKSPGLGGDYSDFSIGVRKMFNSLEAKLAVTATTQEPSSDANDTTLVLALKYQF